MATNIETEGIKGSLLTREASPIGVDVIGVKNGRTVKTSLDNLATKEELREVQANSSVGTLLLGDRENIAAIKLITDSKTGHTYKANDTGDYWTYKGENDEPYDATKWENIGKILPSDALLPSDVTDKVEESSKVVQSKAVYDALQTKIDSTERYDLLAENKVYLFADLLTVRRYTSATVFNEFPKGQYQTVSSNGLSINVPQSGTSDITHHFMTGLTRYEANKYIYESIVGTNTSGLHVGFGYKNSSGDCIQYCYSFGGILRKSANFATTTIQTGLTALKTGDILRFELFEDQLSVYINNAWITSIVVANEYVGEILISQVGFGSYVSKLTITSDPIRNYVKKEVAESVGTQITDLREEIEELEDKFEVRKDVKGKTVVGYYRKDVGLTGTVGFTTSAFIPVALGDKIYSNTQIISTALSTAYFPIFDNNKNIIGVLLTADATNSVWTITQAMINLGAAYVRITSRDTDTPKLIVEKLMDKTMNDVFHDTILQPLYKNIPYDFRFADKLPTIFRDKFNSMPKDLEVLLIGDSLVALVDGVKLNNPQNLPPSCTHDHFTYQMWNSLCTNKPQYDRFDSTVNQITENGAFVISNVEKFNLPADKGEQSPESNIYRESSAANSSVSFQWNLADYEKLNFIHRLGIDATTEVTVSCVTNQVQVYDRTSDSWIEANGYKFSQWLEETPKSSPLACWIRNFPLKFKRIATTGNVTITLTNTGSGMFYYWGTERWNYNTIRVTNIARAGRHITLLQSSVQNDVGFRKPDLVILELPLYNEIKGGESVDVWHARHITYLNYIKTLSNDFADCQVIVLIPHTWANDWQGNKALPFDNRDVRTNITANDWYKECLFKLQSYNPNVVVLNLMQCMYNYAVNNDITMEDILTGSSNESTFTVDGVHTNTSGSKMWSNCLIPMFK